VTQSSKGFTKQEVLDEVSRLLEGPQFHVASGATEPREFFDFVVDRLQIQVRPNASKPELARLITGATGGSWDRTCDSTASPSGGGGTVTNEGLRRVLESVQRFSADKNLARGNFTVDVRPDASALRIFRNMSYTEWYALGEFIDNSITSSMQNHDELVSRNGRDYKLRVEIEIDKESKSIVVRDNAAGITRENIASAVRAGSMPVNNETGLSIHGVGMKAAAFWWGSRLSIETHPISSSVGWSVVIDLDEIDERRNGDIRVEEIKHRGFPGTVITIGKLHKGVPRTKTISTIRSYLPSIYRTFVGRSELGDSGLTGITEVATYPMELFYQEENLVFSRPSLLTSPEWANASELPPPGSPEIYWYEEIDFTIEVAGVSKRVSGWVGLLEVMSRELAGFFLHFRGKGVSGVVPVKDDNEEFEEKVYKFAYRPRSLFGQEGHYLIQRLTGELDISDFGKTLTTDDVVWSPEEESMVIEQLKVLLTRPGKNFLRHGKSFRVGKQRHAEKNSSEKIFGDVSDAFITGIKTSGLHHGPAAVSPESANNSGISHDYERLDEGQMTILEKVIADGEHDDHHFRLEIIKDMSKPFIDVHEFDSERKHIIRINKLHPAFSSLPPIEGSLETLLATIGIALGVAEVFLTSYQKTELRDKLNEVMSKFAHSD
jgi:hypothetical protein